MKENEQFSGMTLLGVYQAFCDPILMKFEGNQAGAFPDLPIQPRNLSLSRKTQFIALEFFKQVSLKTTSDNFSILLTTVYFARTNFKAAPRSSRGGSSGFWRLTSEKTVSGDKEGNS